MEIYQSPFCSLTLARSPQRKRETLRAWDAADEYLLNFTVDKQLVHANSRIVLLNDSFGALAVTLCTAYPSLRPVSIGDSWLSQRGTEHNLQLNRLAEDSVELRDTLNWPAHDAIFDVALIKIPKSLSLLEDQLHRLRSHITAETTVVAATMAKHMHNSHLQLFESLLGTTTTSLAKKKARLAFVTPDNISEKHKNPYPKPCHLPELGLEIHNHANVFSRDKLDIGTRFFLEHLPIEERYRHIVDLGCGNGLLGIVAARNNPEATVTFVDESFMAVASAQQNFSANCPGREAEFTVTDCLQGIKKDSADLILNNPPFHQQNAVSTHIAEQMFRESKQVLKAGGELWVIGNRHLGYHVKLKRLFSNCQTVASNNKFVILKVVKRAESNKNLNQ